VLWLDDGALAKFIKALKLALAKNHQLLAWEGYDLELQGDSPTHLAELERALEERRRPQVLISYAQVYDLTHYASRVQEIGFEKPYYSPYIAKKQDADGWFPENLVNIISWVPEGGFGVNIQAANHVVHYTRTWNPAKEDQATDRAYRIGQTKDVYVYYPVVHAEDFTTFDVKLDRLLETKRGLANDMLNGSGDLRPGEFGLDDVAPPDSALESEPVTLSTALAMNWEYFEALATVLYAKRGFEAYRTPSSKDNGVDVVALPRDESKGKLVQAKSSGTDGALLDWDAVKEVLGGNAFYCKQFPKVAFDLVCMTNQYFDKQAHMNADLNNIELVEQPVLAEMLKGTPVTLLEVEQVLFTEWTQG